MTWTALFAVLYISALTDKIDGKRGENRKVEVYR
jgi:hypothetical protein